MSITINKLTVTKVRSITKPGRHSDGGGLFLKVRKSGSKAWVFKYKKKGKVTELGLGAVHTISLAEVRGVAREMRKRVDSGLPAIETVKKEDEVPSFLEVVNLVLETKDSLWTNDKTRVQWHMTLKKYAKPLHHHKINEITTPDVLRVLKPLWLSKNETASRLRGRIEAVMDYAKAMGWRTGENPALWRGNLNLLLPAYSKTKNVKHHAALDVDDIPLFMNDLRARDAMVARLLEFIILTASRSGEARFATWDEIDFEGALWTLSADRMKMSKAHVVPLSQSVLNLLTILDKQRSDKYIFTHPSTRKVFSINATRALLQRMRKERLTTHGFRSTFRDWAGDRTLHQRETIEAALAHSIKDRAEAAYRRSTAIEKRRLLMQDWDDYGNGKSYHPNSIIPHLTHELHYQ